MKNPFEESSGPSPRPKKAEPILAGNTLTKKERKNIEDSEWARIPVKDITLIIGDRTPRMEDNTMLIIGSDPQQDNLEPHEDYAYTIKIDFENPEIAQFFSRQAVVIAYIPIANEEHYSEKGIRIRKISESNSVWVRSTDQPNPCRVELQKGAPLGRETWKKIGNHPSIDIEIGDGSWLTLESAGSAGEFDVKHTKELKFPNGRTLESYKNPHELQNS